ncbi:MAG: hypothetical protein HYT37_00715 [Candidatus Sungbacteria bacterium]|nr:hypothetical protein [Candidatus Sungbacteria bacterium]
MRKKPVVIAVLLTIFLGYGAGFVKDRSPIEDLILDGENPIRLGEEYVRSKVNEGFAPTDPVLYLTDTRSSPGWSRTLCNFEKYAGFFGTVFGLCTTPFFYIEHGEEIDIAHDEAPFVVDGVLSADWQTRLAKSMVFKNFAGDNFGYVVTAVFLPQMESELKQAELAVKIAQMGKGISWYEILNLDVRSLWYGVSATGWVVGRYLIHVMLMASTMLLAIGGVGIVLMLGFRSTFGSWRLAGIAVLHIWAALICQTGAMALFGVQRSVFTLVAQMIPFLIGTSAMPEVFEKRGKATTPYLWAGGLTIASALMYVLPYLGFEVTHIHEFSYAVILGTFFMTFLSLYSFPCFLRKSDIPQNTEGSRINLVSNWLNKKLIASARWFSEGSKTYALIVGVLLLYISTAWMVAVGEIKTATDSKVYIKNTSVAKGLDRLDRPGGMGQSLVEMLIECDGGRSIVDPTCAKELIVWHHAVEEKFATEHQELRAIFSIVKMFEEIAIGTEEDPGILAHMPKSTEEINLVWPAMKSRLAQLDRPGKPTYQSQLWCGRNDDCFRVIFGISIVTDAELRQTITALQEFNAKNFPHLRTTFYGKNALYSQLGPYVTEGKVKNSFTSVAAVGITSFIFLAAIQRRRARKISPLTGGLVAVVPFLFAPSVFLFVLWIGKSPLDVVAATVSSFAIAAAGDFMVLLLFAFVENIKKNPNLNLYGVLLPTLEQEGPLRTRDMILNIGAFSVFALCVLFEPVQMLGISMMLITFLCLVGTLVFSMAILMRILRPAEQPHADSPTAVVAARNDLR